MKYSLIDAARVPTYDLSGNMVNDGAGRTDSFNAENQMVSGSNGTDSFIYAYDPFGRRMVKDVNDGETFIRYVYDGPHVVAELDEEGTVLRSYVYGPGIDEPLVMRVHIPEGPDEDYYYHRDALGNVMALSDENGNIVEGYTYSAFGCTIVNTDDGADNDWLTPESGSMATVSQVGNPYMFTGRRYDPESGLYYYRARYYDPALGRFISADPIRYAGGMNLYAYCNNNPINWCDPWGLEKEQIKREYLNQWDINGELSHFL